MWELQQSGVSREFVASSVMERTSPTSAPLLSAATVDASRKKPEAWREFTDPNGRGTATLTGFLLGVATNVTAVLLILAPSSSPFAVYLGLLIIFHMLEYLLTAAFRPDTLSFDNFLLNHSKAYQACVALAWTEYWVEYWLVGSIKEWNTLSSLGLCLCLVGLVTRSLGMATASTNFSHRIEEEKRPEHRLVTHGIYAYLRHPAYFGFFWWSVGTQVRAGSGVRRRGRRTAAFAASTHPGRYARIVSLTRATPAARAVAGAAVQPGVRHRVHGGHVVLLLRPHPDRGGAPCRLLWRRVPAVPGEDVHWDPGHCVGHARTVGRGRLATSEQRTCTM